MTALVYMLSAFTFRPKTSGNWTTRSERFQSIIAFLCSAAFLLFSAPREHRDAWIIEALDGGLLGVIFHAL
jgi:hypothetical protein